MGTNVAGTWDKAAQLLQECSTKQPGSDEADAALLTVKHLEIKVRKLPPQPKAVWKKLVQQLKIPLRLGAAFATAAQHSWKSPCTQSALVTLQSLVRTANAAGVTKSTSSSSSLASSIRQQLEQSGMLQQLAAVMTAAAADLQDKAAAYAAGGWGQEQTVLSTANGLLHARLAMCVYDLMIGLWDPQSPDVDIVAWLCHPNGHAAAGMQLTTAVLQHASVLAQHVLPGMRERLPQQADELLGVLQPSTRIAQAVATRIMFRVVPARARWQQQGQGQGSAGASLQQLLLSPESLPFIATMLVLLAADVSSAMAAHNGQVGGSSGGSTAAPTGQQQHAPGGDSSSRGSSSSSSSAEVSDTPSLCQLRLLKLLGLAHEMTAWEKEPIQLPAVCGGLRMALAAYKAWYNAVVDPSDCSGLPSWQLQLQQQQQQQQQRGQVEQQFLLLPMLLLLLPAILLPCASRLLSPNAQHLLRQQSQPLQLTVHDLFEVSSSMVIEGDALMLQQESLGWRPPRPTEAWVQEVLGVVLRSVEQMLQQQPPTQAGSTGGSSSNDSRPASAAAEGAPYLARLLPLICTMVHFSQSILCQPNSSGNGTNSNNSSSSLRHAAAAAAAPKAATYVRLGPALEAVLRAVTTAVQSGTVCKDVMPLLKDALFPISDLLCCDQGYPRSALMQHMGLCGPDVLAQEQRQLYSLLSTVLKMGQPCWGEQAPGSCCLAAGEAAVGLLLQPPTGSLSSSAAAGAAGAAAQQPAVDHLPSLVIFGRCCLQWAEQLKQQMPTLLLPTSVQLPPQQQQQQQERREVELHAHAHSAALVCVPGLRSGAATRPGGLMESLAANVSEWVRGVEAPAALAQLAAAGCAPQQLQQRLQALLLVVQGTQQLTSASLTALVQQLQETGAMLCNVAVPHFCNNSGCVNISACTEMQLVSGRSCICAGCRIARYCGRSCQRAAWKLHKPVCKALAAAAGDISTPAGG